MKQKRPVKKSTVVSIQKRQSPLDTILGKRKPTMKTIISLVQEIKTCLTQASRFSEVINAFNKQTVTQTAKDKRVSVLYGPGRRGSISPT